MKHSGRSVWFILSTILFCALLGGVYGRQVEATTSSDDNSSVQTSLSEFTKVFGAVEQNYADPVNADRAIFGPTDSNEGAIPGMLHTLDPHSNFFDPTAFSRLRENQEGKYYGVGMTILTRPGPMGNLETFVNSPMPGSPALRAGLRAGDVILKVNGKLTNGSDAPREQYARTTFVADMLKGPKNTTVVVTVSRLGVDHPLNFTVTRGEIPKKSVDDAFMVRPGIGYIHLNGFTDATNDEISAALHEFGQDNLRGLVFDLRGNPGGILDQAVEVADHFLEKGQLIVYHYGRSSREKRYYATHGDNGHEYPIVVLIDHMSASAAEIVAGALQDHDRALIIGERSFGKGLVQTVFPLSDDTGLALTTAHYYTPSGRLIQRSYDNISLYDYYNGSADGATPHTEVRLTDGGREVYGGGGITPDVQVTEPNLTPPQIVLVERAAFYNFADQYKATHPTLPEDFQVTDAMVQEFRTFLAEHQIKMSDKDFNANLDYIKTQMRERLTQDYFGQDKADEVAVEDDLLVQKALADMDQARDLMAHAKKYMAAQAQKP
jgi:carboxyl-terminal processing protease